MPTDLKRERGKLIEQWYEADKKTGLRLALLRYRKGYKAMWVANRMGISQSIMSGLENGKRHWTPELEAAFLEAIGETNNKKKGSNGKK